MKIKGILGVPSAEALQHAKAADAVCRGAEAAAHCVDVGSSEGCIVAARQSCRCAGEDRSVVCACSPHVSGEHRSHSARHRNAAFSSERRAARRQADDPWFQAEALPVAAALKVLFGDQELDGMDTRAPLRAHRARGGARCGAR